jgi:hypothetical protein
MTSLLILLRTILNPAIELQMPAFGGNAGNRRDVGASNKRSVPPGGAFSPF